MRITSLRTLAVAAAVIAVPTFASAAVINFESLAANTVVATQFPGVTFAAGGGGVTGVINPPGTTQGFATNTDVKTDTLANAGAAAPLAGIVFHNEAGWLSENGDPVMTLTFASPISALSIDFGAVGTAQPTIFAVNPTTGIAITAGSTTVAANQTVTAVLPTAVTTIILTPGNYFDYVAIDNINYTTAAVAPEPVSLLSLSAAAAGLMVRRRRAMV